MTFELSDQYGETHALGDFRGKWLVVFFYPKADTPGCTTEACNFRDNIYAIRGAGAEVVGISVDSVEDQKKFSEKYKLPFTILSDTGGRTCDDYGVLRSFGTMEVANRESFLVNPEGTTIGMGFLYPDPSDAFRALGGDAARLPDLPALLQQHRSSRLIFHTMAVLEQYRAKGLVEAYLTPVLENAFSLGLNSGVGALAKEGPTLYHKTGEFSREYLLYRYAG